MQFSNPPKEDSVEHVVISGESNAHREKLGEQEQIIPLLFQTIQVFKKRYLYMFFSYIYLYFYCAGKSVKCI